MPEIAVILPTLNERENLAPMIARIEAALAGLDWEAIVIDDDSPDGTADEARALARTNRRVSVIHRVGRRGLASAVIEGVCATAAPVVAAALFAARRATFVALLGFFRPAPGAG